MPNVPLSPPVILTVAGFDPSSGAGVTADVKTASAHGCYAVSAITALTVQSTQGVRRVEPVDPELLRKSLEELAADFEIRAVRLGMLGSSGVAKVVADFLERAKLPNLVLDPILRSSSGAELLDSAGTKLLAERLLPLSAVVTPNIDEAAVLTGLPVTNLEEMRAAAAKLHSMGAEAVVITGGHLDKAVDLLSTTTKHGIEEQVFKSEKIQSKATHGTGCAFATAITCHLALDRGLSEAVLLAKAFVSAAITNAQPLGKGIGPLHHLYRMGQQRRAAAAAVEIEH